MSTLSFFSAYRCYLWTVCVLHTYLHSVHTWQWRTTKRSEPGSLKNPSWSVALSSSAALPKLGRLVIGTFFTSSGNKVAKVGLGKFRNRDLFWEPASGALMAAWCSRHRIRFRNRIPGFESRQGFLATHSNVVGYSRLNVHCLFVEMEK
jgi:hypothetical protein